MLWILFALGSAVLMTIGSIIDKRVMRHEHAMEYGAGQGVFAFILLLALPFIPLRIPWQLYAAMYVSSALFVAGHLYYLRSIRHSELSSSFPLTNISPLFLLVIAFVLLGERPSGIDITGVLLLILGTYLLQSAGCKGGLLEPLRSLARSRYALYMVLAMVVFSFTATLEKGIMNRGVEALTMAVVLRLFIASNHLVLEVYRHGAKEVFRDVRKDGGSLLAASLAGIGASLLYFMALAVPGALVSLVIPVKRVSTLLSALIGGTLFHEHRLGVKLAACCVMIAGVALVAL